MDRSKFEIRPSTLPELRVVLGWAAEEGWNPGRSDAEVFFKTDPDGFFGAFVEDKLVGAISAVRYGDEFSFVGLFIVKPELRGGPIGPLLGKRALERLAGVNIGVDGVEKKIRNYEGYGFKMAHYNIRHQGFSSKAKTSGAKLNPLRDIPFEKLLSYDAGRFPARREAFLRAWIEAEGHYGLASLNAKGEVEGYGVLRPCVEGYKVGPLFAKDAALAKTLLKSLLAHVPESSRFQLDVPADNAAALALVSELGLKAVFRTARMYNLARPRIAENEVFGISSFELG